MRYVAFMALIPACLVLMCPEAPAQTYPTELLRLIAPSWPGSGVDIVARFYAQKLAAKIKQQVVVENRAGAGANRVHPVQGQARSHDQSQPLSAAHLRHPARLRVHQSGVQRVVRGGYTPVIADENAA
jgi:hypothetical protein